MLHFYRTKLEFVLCSSSRCYCKCGSPSVPVTAVSWMLSVLAQALHGVLYTPIYSLLTWSYLGILQGYLRAFEKFRRAIFGFVTSVCLSIRPSSTWWTFIEFDILTFFENLPRTFKFYQNLPTIITVTSLADRYTFIISSFRVRNVSGKNIVQKSKSYFTFSNLVF